MVREIISIWEVEHVIALPLNAMDSIREEVDSFSINAKDGRVFAFLRDQVIGCSTLLRLIQGSIWSHGIIGELQREIKPARPERPPALNGLRRPALGPERLAG
jgi:ABC-type multidrug transport system ATPase subunit